MLPNLHLQSFDEQRTPSSSENDAEEYKSQRSQFGPRSETGRVKRPIRNESSLFIRNLPKRQTEYTQSNFGDYEHNAQHRKILYRVSKKIYTPEEIELIRKAVKTKKKFFHYCTSFLMIMLIIAMNAVILYKIVTMWTNKYEENLASVKIQDPSISNYVSTVSVIRYFLYNNKSGDIVYINGVAAVQGSTAYTDVSTI